MTKSQPTTTPIAAMNGNLNLRRSSKTDARTSSSSDMRATEKPWKGNPFPSLAESQPNQTQSEPTKNAQATTAAKAKMPAASQRSRRLRMCAIA